MWNDVLREIDRLTAPDRMSQDHAVVALEELGADLDARIEALREEMADG